MHIFKDVASQERTPLVLLQFEVPTQTLVHFWSFSFFSTACCFIDLCLSVKPEVLLPAMNLRLTSLSLDSSIATRTFSEARKF